jgi:8-oxo-(d)GTP phosphatase
MNDEAALVIKAAGGVVYRQNESGRRVFAVIHKREYGEWCLPKGKLQGNEDWKDAAAREVNEETGSLVRILEPVSVNGYLVKGIPKIVVFFAMQASASPAFTPSSEVDCVEWLNEAELRGRLSHAGERRAFDEIIRALDAQLGQNPGV